MVQDRILDFKSLTKPMFKPSGFFVTQEELVILNTSEYPGAVARDLLDKYHFPADAGIDRDTGEVFFETA